MQDGAAERPTSGILAADDSLRVQSVFVTLARALRTVFAIAVPIVLVRTLDPSTFGQYKQISLLTTTAVGVLTLGIPASLYYFVPRSPAASQSLLVRSFVLLGGVGLVCGAAVFLGSAWLDAAFSSPLSSQRLWIALLVAVTIPEAMADAVAVVDRRARLAAAAGSVLEVLRSGVVVAAALVTRDLGPVLAAVVLGLGLRLAAVAVYLAWRGRTHHDETARASTGEQLRYALPFHGAAMIGLARDQLHSYFVATQYAAAQYAIYAVGITTLPLVDKLTQSVAEVVVVDASKNFALGRLDEVRRVWWRGSYGIALALVPTFVIFEAFAPDVIALLYGADYVESAAVMRIYLLTILLWIPLSSVVLRASASPRTMLVADVASLLGTLGTLALTARSLGPRGAVASLVAGLFVFNLVAGRTVAKRLGIGLREFLPWARLAGVFAVCGVATGLAALATWSLGSVPRAFAGPALAGALTLGGLWLTPLLPEAERELVRSVVRRARGRLPGAGAPPGG